MSSESGIDLDFDVFAEIEQDSNWHNYYEVKTKSLKPSRSNPSLLMDPDMVTIKPDPDASYSLLSDSIQGTSPLMRTNFKLQLQREHLLELEKKEMRKHISQQTSQANIRHLQQPQRLNFPATSSPLNNESQATIPIKGIRSSIPPNVPSSVLKVETKLQNPTQYYIRQQQKRQVQEYLSNQLHNNSASVMPTSAPSALQSFNFGCESTSPNFLNPTSNLMSPNSPDTTSSVASGSEVDIVFDDLFGLEASSDQDFNMFSENVFAATLPTNNNLLDTYGHNSKQRSESTEIVSASCPAEVKKESPELYLKERQKKDNHNMIERRRRYNINDRIKELGSLVPKLDNDFKQNKGTILKSSVDYIRRLQKDRERMKKYESRNHTLEEMNKRLLLRIQEMELILRAANISTTLPEPNLSSANTPQLTQLLMGNQNNVPLVSPHQQKNSGTPQQLLKVPRTSSSGRVASEAVINNSIDSPRQMDLTSGSLDDDESVLMEGD